LAVNWSGCFEGETPVVRERLLAIKGIGPETADSMLLYAASITALWWMRTPTDFSTARLVARAAGEGGQGKQPRGIPFGSRICAKGL